LIPEMAVGVETRSASVAVARFEDPQPARTVGMVWRRKSPLAGQLLQISEVVRRSATAWLGEQKPCGIDVSSDGRPSPDRDDAGGNADAVEIR